MTIDLAGLRAKAEAATTQDWQAYFTIHGDGQIVPTDEPYPSARIADISTAPDDYGRANCEFMGAASPRRVIAMTVALEKVRALMAEWDALFEAERGAANGMYEKGIVAGLSSAATYLRRALDGSDD